MGGKKRNDVERGEDGFGELWDVNQEVQKDSEGLESAKSREWTEGGSDREYRSGK